MAILTDNEIMVLLQKEALTYGVKLTYTQKVFYLRLLMYAMSEGEPCSEGLKVSLSVNDMSSCLSISKRMVVNSLRVLSDCGILLRYKGENTFPRSSDVTVMKKQFFERKE